jgi:hypothetical protein
MAISEAYNGNPTVGASEYDMPSASTSVGVVTTDGIYQLFLDCNAIAEGDRFDVKIYEKVQSGGTQRVCQKWIIAGAQADPIWVAPSLILINGWTMTITKVAGTDRAIPFSIRSVA